MFSEWCMRRESDQTTAWHYWFSEIYSYREFYWYRNLQELYRCTENIPLSWIRMSIRLSGVESVSSWHPLVFLDPAIECFGICNHKCKAETRTGHPGKHWMSIGVLFLRRHWLRVVIAWRGHTITSTVRSWWTYLWRLRTLPQDSLVWAFVAHFTS